MSNIQLPQTQSLDNKRIIEEWMKRNNTGRIIIESNNSPIVSPQNERRSLPSISIAKNLIAKKEREIQSIKNSNIPPNKLLLAKRNLTKVDVVPKKLARWSIPIVSIQIEPSNKDVGQLSAEEKSCTDPLSGIIVTEVPKSVKTPNGLETKLSVQSPLRKTHAQAKNGIQNGKSHTIKSKRTGTPKSKEKDVYSRVRHSYKNLLMPQHWSATEFVENDLCKQCILFSKPLVIRQNDQLTTVMQKSLVIDKGGTIHYSVHGLPVDVKGTILPNILDNIQKLLSILHIFDKMQVCKGLGDDLLVVKTDNLQKDICQVLRHKSCKLLLVKADQCQNCLDSRNVLLEKEILFKSEILTSNCVNVAVKEEVI